jgi:hypothetical protein
MRASLSPSTARRQAAETEIADKLVAGGLDPHLVRAGIALIRRGSADLIERVLAGELTVTQAASMARGRP